ncbi:MAG: PQQ-dependent sugar dehydrogenase [Cyclobacteriaceae bacterium]|nr:PQQ-dependent sugar dehydrogenase [Cyclobacteriaceae bacterium]
MLWSITVLTLFVVSCNTGQKSGDNNTIGAANASPLKNGAVLYANNCAGCHGPQLQGSAGPALVNTIFKHGDDFNSISKSIREGIASTTMMAYSNILSEKQIEDITTYIVEAGKSPELIVRDNVPLEVTTKHYELKIEQLIEGELKKPWGFEFVNADSILVTFNKGELRWLVNGKLDPKVIDGTPKTYASDMFGGMMDLALDPNYKKNGWIYLAYSYNSANATDKHTPGTTKVVRGKVKNYRWVDEQVLFQAHDSLFVAEGMRWGCRFLFDKQGYLYFTIGEMLGPKGGGGRRPQLLTRPEGKIFRINSDGTIPKDNPLYGKKNVLQAIYVWGTRNVQGIAMHPITGEIYFSDHGPQGGDELNRLKNGANYGWPDITYGIDYDGSVISNNTHADGMEQPMTYWTPSIAVSAIEFVSGNRFPEWNNNLLVTALKFEEVRRLVIENNEVKEQEILLKGYGRVRDIKIGLDGAIYVLTNTPDALWRITPKQ